jgi:SNF2 family DNA or RNA helicase
LQEKAKKKKRREDWISGDEADAKPTIKKKGPLFKMAWYRIVLDEAAVVRNKSTKASKCILELVGDIRWCLTVSTGEDSTGQD